jgi:hypothetical protein
MFPLHIYPTMTVWPKGTLIASERPKMYPGDGGVFIGLDVVYSTINAMPLHSYQTPFVSKVFDWEVNKIRSASQCTWACSRHDNTS